MATSNLAPRGPSAKEKKYDRQLRLWGANGQAELENAHLLLINSGAIGVEALKNLVLPGIGEYTILDPARVKEADLGTNFFLDERSLGRWRAEETCKYLQELNPDVKGHFITDSPATLATQPDSLLRFSHIIITAPVAQDTLTALVDHAKSSATPVFYLHCVGFYASFSIFLPPIFPIVETHPDPDSAQDLRLVKPWPALSEFVAQRTHGLEQMDDHDHGHMPYILILLHYLEQWKASHLGAAPATYKEKSEFRDFVRAGMRTKNAEGGEENYEEAVAAVLKSLNEPAAPNAVREIFASPECANLLNDVRPFTGDRELSQSLHPSKKRKLTPTLPSGGGLQSANFWVIAHAISLFWRRHGVLPLPGAVPDMKAQSKDYIALQNVYKSKAREDVDEVMSTVRDLERKLGRGESIEAAEVEIFCKNAAHIKLIRGRPFHVAAPPRQYKWGERARWAAGALTDDASKLPLYIAFLAWDMFCAQEGKEPASIGLESAKLQGMAHGIVENLLDEATLLNLNSAVLDESEHDAVLQSIDNISDELCRSGGGEVHNVAAVAGGLVAQEVIKVITKQYVPVDNTCLFDGVRSETAVIKI